jgi:hypothetical protein
MYLVSRGAGCTYGGWPGMSGLCRPEDNEALIKPFTPNAKAMYFHFFSDANLKERSTTGGIGMLAGGPIVAISQRQGLKAPDSHSAEVVAAGVNLNAVVPVNGVLQEMRIRCGQACPFYLDSKTTVFVAMSDSAIKKSVWLSRRVAVINEGTTAGEILPMHIGEADMVADPSTKYLPYTVWHRHMHYLLNTNPPGYKSEGKVDWT